VTCAILFAKDPQPGQVKTRLQPLLSAQLAAQVYAAFLRDSAETLAACQAGRKVVAFAPATGGDSLRSLLSESTGLGYEPQPEGDLGQRMASLCRWAITEGCEGVLLLGSDSPAMPASYIDQGLARLAAADVVIGPCVDGGYCLLGLRADAFESAAPALFEGIDWSTGRVLEQTVAALPDEIRLALLPTWYDVDLPEEVGFLRAHLMALARSGDTDTGRHSARLLADLEQLPPPS
jgi:hypothetical protein